MPTIDKIFTHRPKHDSVPITPPEVVEEAAGMGAREEPVPGVRAIAGATAGVLGGVLMFLLVMLYTWASAGDFWMVPRAVAALWYGADAMGGGAWIVTVGVLTHVATAIGLGALFGLLSSRRNGTAAATGSAAIYGVLVWLIMTWAVVPVLNSTMADFVGTMPVVWFLSHVLFAIPLVGVPASTRRIAQHRDTRPRRVARASDRYQQTVATPG